jgi:GNAT superfamily N-acetyltransferase
LNIPAVSIPAEEAVKHFGFLGPIVGADNPASSEKTRQALGWQPPHPSLLQDLAEGFYFEVPKKPGASNNPGALADESPAGILIRPQKQANVSLLEEFLYQAVFVPPGHKPPPREVTAVPEVRVYIEDFGKPDDYLIVAEENGVAVGAAWSRILADPAKRGYGNIDEQTPELAIAVMPEYRGRGIGTKLLRELCAQLAGRGYKRLSLSVQKANPAADLYRRNGFEVIRENAEDYIMVKRFRSA